MENNKDTGKVKIQLERHIWPDERKKQRLQLIKRSVIVIAITLAFLVGYLFRGTLNSSSSSTVSTGNAQLDRFAEVYNSLLNDWYFANDMSDPSTELINNAINGMIDKDGDIHTEYMTKDEYTQLFSSINGNFVGIGVQYISQNNLNLITKVFNNSPAEKAGIQAGDRILKVDGEDVSGWDSTKLVQNITGTEGSTVTVTIDRNGVQKDFAIVRGSVNTMAYGKMVSSDTGYLELTSFGDGLYDSTKAYLQTFKSQNATKLIIDLRDNGGGLLSAIQSISKLFVPKGANVYSEETKDGKISTYKSTTDPEFSFDKIVILINQNTASAAEVMTLSLTENGLNASTVGTTSYGKGTVQVTSKLKSGDYLKVTIAKWLDPQGNNIHGVGITPDVEVRLADFFYASYVNLDDGVQIKYDSVSDGASYAQKALQALGYNVARTDGYFDSTTLSALLSYQSSVNMTADGIITKAVLAQLYSSVISDYYNHIDTKDTQLMKAIEIVHE